MSHRYTHGYIYFSIQTVKLVKLAAQEQPL